MAVSTQWRSGCAVVQLFRKWAMLLTNHASLCRFEQVDVSLCSSSRSWSSVTWSSSGTVMWTRKLWTSLSTSLTKRKNWSNERKSWTERTRSAFFLFLGQHFCFCFPCWNLFLSPFEFWTWVVVKSAVRPHMCEHSHNWNLCRFCLNHRIIFSGSWPFSGLEQHQDDDANVHFYSAWFH